VIIEKHITLDRNAYGNDHSVSLTPCEFGALVSGVRDVKTALKSYDQNERTIGPGEKANRLALSKSLAYKKDLLKNSLISANDLTFIPVGSGIPVSDGQTIIGKRLMRDVQGGKPVETSDFSLNDLHVEHPYRQVLQSSLAKRWGVPVRFCDAEMLFNKLSPEYIEFHYSFGDLEWQGDICDLAFFSLSSDRFPTIGFHAPDIYAGQHIFAVSSKSESYREKSLLSFDNFIQHVNTLVSSLPSELSQSTFKVVTSFSYISDETPSKVELAKHYQTCSDIIKTYERRYPYLQILPQYLPCRAWYLGGQRHNHAFSDTGEVSKFYKDYGHPICLDTAHLAMACIDKGLDFDLSLRKMLEISAHVHLADSRGVDDEGLALLEGTMNKERILTVLDSGLSFIIETWQGHLSGGRGFEVDAMTLSDVVASRFS